MIGYDQVEVVYVYVRVQSANYRVDQVNASDRGHTRSTRGRVQV